MSKNKKMLVALTVSVVLFLTSAFVAFANGSGYTSFKNAIFNTFELENYSYKSIITFKIDGEIVELREDNSIQSKNAYLMSWKKELTNYPAKNYEGYLYGNDHESISYNENKEIINFSKFDSTMNTASYQNIITQKQRVFYNMLIDTVVGDTKNFVMTDGNTIYGEIDELQVPPLVQAFTAVVMESNGQYRSNTKWEFNDIDAFFSGQDIKVKSVKGNAELTDDDLIKTVNGSIVFENAKGENLEILIEVEVYDIGTSNPLPFEEIYASNYDQLHLQFEIDGERYYAVEHDKQSTFFLFFEDYGTPLLGNDGEEVLFSYEDYKPVTDNFDDADKMKLVEYSHLKMETE